MNSVPRASLNNVSTTSAELAKYEEYVKELNKFFYHGGNDIGFREWLKPQCDDGVLALINSVLYRESSERALLTVAEAAVAAVMEEDLETRDGALAAFTDKVLLEEALKEYWLLCGQMQVIHIINEFSDYRAYVSHTLFRHRLLLGMVDIEAARARLNDAYVWPLVGDEIRRLLALLPTLFGFSTEGLDLALFQPMDNLLSDLSKSVSALRAGEDGFADFQQHSEAVGKILSALPALMTEHHSRCVPERCCEFVGPATGASSLNELERMIAEVLAPGMKAMFAASDVDVSEQYRQLLPTLEDARIISRKAIVAGAIENRIEETEVRVMPLRRVLQHIERVLSCWSPTIDPEKRPGLIEQALQDEGFPAANDLLRLLARGGRA